MSDFFKITEPMPRELLNRLDVELERPGPFTNGEDMEVTLEQDLATWLLSNGRSLGLLLNYVYDTAYRVGLQDASDEVRGMCKYPYRRQQRLWRPQLLCKPMSATIENEVKDER